MAWCETPEKYYATSLREIYTRFLCVILPKPFFFLLFTRPVLLSRIEVQKLRDILAPIMAHFFRVSHNVFAARDLEVNYR